MAKTRLIVELAPGLNTWAWSDPDEAFTLVAGGRHTIEGDDLTPDLLRAVGAAVSAGSLVLHSADADSRKTLEAAVEDDKDSLKLLEKADAIRAALLADRDQALDDLSGERGQRLSELDGDDEDAVKDELALFNAHRDQILAGHDERVDAEIRARLTEAK